MTEANSVPSNVELEASVLGAMLIDNGIIDLIADTLTSADFSQGLHRRIFESACHQHAKTGATNPATLHPLFKDDPDINELGGPSYLAKLTASSSGQLDPKGFARQLASIGRRRRVVEGLMAATDAARDPHVKLTDAIGIADEAIGEKAIATIRESDAADCFDEMFAGYEQEDRGVTCKIIPTLDHFLGSLKPGSLNIMAGRPGMGKAQPLAAKVLTPEGWVTMGSLRVGDMLASVDGHPSQVTGVFPQGRKEVFEVTFSDERATQCCAEHLWSVTYRDWSEPRVISTAKLTEMLQKVRYKNRLSITRVDGNFGCGAELGIDPWLLGFLLGDGSICGDNVKFSTADREILDRVKSVIPNNLFVRKERRYCYAISSGICHSNANQITAALRELGLWGTRSHDKFIPAKALRGERQTRLELLRGLMDSDGWAEKFCAVRFASASKKLAEGVQYLVRSLGGLCSIREKRTTYTYKGKKFDGKKSFVCRIRADDADQFFSLDRKCRRAKRTHNSVSLNVTSIKKIGVADCQCISVSHPSRLYVTDDFVVTHNTAVALSYARGAAEAGHGTLLVSLEMPGDQIAQRMAADLCYDEHQLEYRSIRDGRLTSDETALVRGAQARVAQMPLRIACGSALPVGRLASLIRRTKRRFEAHGVSLDLVVIDYLQLLRPDQKGNRYEAITEISMALKAMALDNDVAILALAQLSRAVEQRDDKRPMLSDLRESGQLEQDADSVTFLLRKEYYLQKEEPPKTDEAYLEWQGALASCRDKIEFIVAKRRNGVEGSGMASFFGKYQAVRG